jgi:GDP-4-dehydro-6-deoxy-D-mannose reductase
MKKVLITGASGFVGSHLIDLLSQKDYELYGTVFGNPAAELAGVQTFAVDLNNSDATSNIVSQIRPDWVFHLAAQSSPAASFGDGNQTLTNNVVAQANLLDALVKHNVQARVLIVGSAEEYGKVEETDLPIDEQCPLRPMSPYAVSKIAQDFMGLQYYLSYGLECVRVRPFNHVGERQAPVFVLPAFAKQVALIEAGKQEPVMMVGNLSATRDFTDVKDMVAAYELALLHGQAGDVYNLGSGNEIAIEDLLTMLLEQSTASIVIKQDPARMQKSDVPRLKANNQKFSQLTGWKTEISFSDTVGRVLNYWRKSI